MRSGALSDEAIKRDCAEFFPVPFNATKILMHKKDNTSGLQFRESKYVQPPARPKDYYAMSNSMAKHLDPTNVQALTSRLSETYFNEMNNDNAGRPGTPPTLVLT